MARLCVQGRRMLYRYCDDRGVPYNKCGKLIVATTERETETLVSIKARAEANGVEGMRLLDAADATAIEPELSCTGALLSPATGIVDSHRLMAALRSDAEAAGTIIAFHSPMERGRVADGGLEIEVGGGAPITLRARLLVNSAGLHAPELARRIDGAIYDSLPTAFYAKGNYFRLSGASPFSRLIYPVPVPGGLGVHHHGRSRWPGAVRPRRRMGRRDRLRRRPLARRRILRRGAPVLAGPEGRCTAPRLCRHPAEDRATRCAGAGLHLPRPREASHPRPDSSLRHRVAGPHRVFGDRRARASDDTRVMTCRGPAVPGHRR